MKENKGYRIMQLFVPVGIYFVGMNLTMLVLMQLLGNSSQEYMMRQTVASAVTVFLLFPIYQRDPLCYQSWNTWKDAWRRQKGREKYKNLFLVFAVALFSSVAWNNILSLSGLVERSASYKQVAEAFFGGRLFWEIVGSGIAAPILEELLYRGILYKRLKNWYSRSVGMILSALIFAAMHMNLVQFLYAFVMGMILVLCMEKVQHLYGAIFGHMVANLFAICRTEFSWFSWIETDLRKYWIETILFTVLAVISVHILTKKIKNEAGNFEI